MLKGSADFPLLGENQLNQIMALLAKPFSESYKLTKLKNSCTLSIAFAVKESTGIMS